MKVFGDGAPESRADSDRLTDTSLDSLSRQVNQLLSEEGQGKAGDVPCCVDVLAVNAASWNVCQFVLFFPHHLSSGVAKPSVSHATDSPTSQTSGGSARGRQDAHKPVESGAAGLRDSWRASASESGPSSRPSSQTSGSVNYDLLQRDLDDIQFGLVALQTGDLSIRQEGC